MHTTHNGFLLSEWEKVRMVQVECLLAHRNPLPAELAISLHRRMTRQAQGITKTTAGLNIARYFIWHFLWL